MAIRSKLRVRFCETDAMGHVNNVSYFMYLEQGRTELMRELSSVVGKNISVILASAKCDFRAQAYFDQELEVVTAVRRLGTSSITLSQKIVDAGSGNVVAEGESVLVHFDPKTQRPVPLTEEWRKALKRHLADVEAPAG
ncbi:MAG: thioesterase family protein [Alicyclobacillaceae bacterium]|nr:thioesterase family protein [Alicyclobacillaceae bacterium]